MNLDVTEVQSTIMTALPRHARWIINGTPLDYDFSQASSGLREISDDLVENPDADWSDLLIFGESSFAEGGGASVWLCVCKPDGAIYGLDPERENAKFLLNSSIERFIQTFNLFDASLGKGIPVAYDLDTVMRRIDPEAYPRSDWQSLVAYLTNRETDNDNQ